MASNVSRASAVVGDRSHVSGPRTVSVEPDELLSVSSADGVAAASQARKANGPAKAPSGLGLQLCGTVSRAGDLSDSDSDTDLESLSRPLATIAGELFDVSGPRTEAVAGGKQLMSPTLESST